MTEVITDPTLPILHGPSDKEKKYDRQLRLWAASGQQALEDAHILLVNSGSGTVGVETLKNLVLPGIGKFTIADENMVDQADLGVNFFLDEDCLGKPRSECCVRLLQELNPDVKGDWFPKNKDEAIEQLFDGTIKFTMLLYTTPIARTRMELLQEYGQKHSVPVIAVHSAGFYSYFRISLPANFPIVDTHPDSTATTDLRLLTPWEELSNFAASLTGNMESLSAHEHGHIPYVALLLHYLAEWKQTHGSFPSTYKEKTAFRSTVAAGARTDTPEGEEENFDEAVAAILKTVSSPSISSSVREMFNYTPNEMESTSSFWIIADAIKQFYKKHNALPLPGSVPDMKAQSTVYVQLQNIYKAKARQDVAEVLGTVRSHPMGKNIDSAEIESFCKNAAFIKLIRGSEPSEASPANIKVLAEREFENDSHAPLTAIPLSLFPIYLSLSATTSLPTSNVSDIIDTIKNTLPDAASTPRIIEAAEEVARANGGELHNISALTGGMVAQEVIKIITRQYIPIDNTCIFDGITSRMQVLRI